MQGAFCVSEVFPGLWLDPAAIFSGDLAAMLAVLQRGLASPERTRLRGTAGQPKGSGPAARIPHGADKDRTRRLSKATATPPFSPVLATQANAAGSEIRIFHLSQRLAVDEKAHLIALSRHTQPIHRFALQNHHRFGPVD